MESTQKVNPPPIRENNDVDLGTVLHKVSQMMSRFFYLLGRLIIAIFRSLVVGLVFLRKNVLWVLIGAVIGLGYGLYTTMRIQPSYQSVSTVRLNFGSTHAFYNAVEYFNTLRQQDRINELSALFKISAEEASSIVHFEATPVINDMIVAEMYRNTFTKTLKDEPIRQDTFWTRTIKFADFKAQLTQYDFPVHQLKAVCLRAEIFGKLQQGFIDILEKNAVLIRNKQMMQEAVLGKKKLLENSIKELDTLSTVYNSRLLQVAPAKELAVTNLSISERNLRAPELELHSTKLDIQRELSSVQSTIITDQDILQVYAPFNPVGQQQQQLNARIFVLSILYGILLVVSILILINVFKILGKINTRTFMRERP